MDSELKELLAKLLGKLEDIESRLKIVESKAHDQVSPPVWLPAQPNTSEIEYWKRVQDSGTSPAYDLYRAIC